MDCRSFHRSLEDYLEGGLDFAGRFGMERHAQQCYICGKTIADAQRLTQAARDMRRVKAPENFEAAVMARIHARDAHAWYRRFWLFGVDLPSLRPWALGATSLAILGLGAFLILERGQLLQQPGPVQGPQVATSIRDGTASRLPASAENAPVPEESNPSGVVGEAAPSGMRRLDVAPDRLSSLSGEPWMVEGMKSSDSDFFEIPVSGPDGRRFIMRLPKTIRMRYGQPSEEYFIRNVSH